MKNLIDISNHEATRFESSEFKFNCFEFTGSETLTHWHSHVELIHILSGCCSIYVNGKLFTCNNNEMVIIPPNCLHSVIPEKNSTYQPILFGDTLLNNILTDIYVKNSISCFWHESHYPPIHISPCDEYYNEYITSVNRIVNEYKSKNSEYHTLIKIEAARLFTLLKRYKLYSFEANYKRRSEKMQIITNAIDLISSKYMDKITIKGISEYSNISEQHFCRLFKTYTGKTLIEFLTQLRMEKAHLLITTTDIPITHIPDLIGICNENYFSRVFKNHYGLAPSKLRVK